MPEVFVEISGRKYRMACEEGQESHLQALAARFDRMVEAFRGEFGEIVEAYNDHLPLIYIFPALTSEEVAHYVALGDEAKRRIRAGDPAGAARAYREQISIFAPNPEPYVSLALLAASHGEQEAALDNMRDAVLRGFTDLGRIERSEGWTGLRRHPRFRYLQDAVPSLVRVENAWAGWDAFRASRPPETVAAALGDHEKLTAALQKLRAEMADTEYGKNRTRETLLALGG